METLLVHARIADAFLPDLVIRLERAGVEVRGARELGPGPGRSRCHEADWDTEYLDLVLSIRIVNSYEEAVSHIARHGSGLAEAIVTSNHRRAMRFLRE